MRIALALVLTACGSSPAPIDPLDWIQTGVDPVEEAARVAHGLEAAGMTLTRRVQIEGAVAIELRRGDQRAIRVVTSRGVVLALDTMEPDGVRVRDGAVRLVEAAIGARIAVATESERGDCLAMWRVEADGTLSPVLIDTASLSREACASELRDVDGDDRPEAIVHLRWPELALDDAAPAIDVPLWDRGGSYPYQAPPVSWMERERAARRTALDAARAHRDVAEASRLGVELAALANLDGAALAAEVELYDGALAGLVLTPEQAARLAQVRAFVIGGWRRRAP